MDRLELPPLHADQPAIKVTVEVNPDLLENLDLAVRYSDLRRAVELEDAAVTVLGRLALAAARSSARSE